MKESISSSAKRYFYYVCQKTMKYPDHVCSLRKIAAPEIEPLICYQLSMIFQTYTMREEIINETDICWREYCRKLVKERSATRQTLKYAKEKSAQQVLEEKIECLTQRFKSFQKGISRQRIDRSIADFNLLWNAMTPPNKINLLDAIVEQIRVYPDKIQTILSVELTELKSEIASRLRYNGSLSSIYLENDRLVFEMPISQKRLNGQNKLEIIGHYYEDNRRCMLHSIATSWGWNQQLISGEFESIAKLAQSVGFSASYVARILSLSSLAPSIIEDVVNGDIPEIFTLERLYRGIPDGWDEQRQKFGFENKNL